MAKNKKITPLSHLQTSQATAQADPRFTGPGVVSTSKAPMRSRRSDFCKNGHVSRIPIGKIRVGLIWLTSRERAEAKKIARVQCLGNSAVMRNE